MKQILVKTRHSERGSAGAKMLAFLAVLFLIGHAGINFIPVAYQGASFKEAMQTAVVQGSALPGGNPVGATEARIKQFAESGGIPPDAVIIVKQIKGGVQAHATYSKKINILPFGLYVYNYQFDHTAAPIGFLMK
ncbi:MAG TPA: hypothetical protein PKE69_03190 [Pyrinomonadaceae bacterium]|nr:hypothetical protein [Pyrinomonadaceae bacterium]